MLASLFVNFFSGATSGGGAEYKRKLPRFLVSTRKLRKAYDRLTREGSEVKAQAEKVAAPFVEAPVAPREVPQPNFAMLARDEEAVDLLMRLLREQDEDDAFMLMLMGAT